MNKVALAPYKEQLPRPPPARRASRLEAGGSLRSGIAGAAETMRKLLIFSLILLILIPLILCLPTLSLPNGSNHVGLICADDLEDVTKKLDEQKQQLADLEKKKEQLAQAIASASVSLAQVSAELEEAEADLAKIQKELSEREKTLKQWETTRNTLIREFYKESRVSPFEVVFSADSFLDSTRQLQYYQDNLSVLKENITVLTGEISTFKQNKAKAEELRNELADLRNQYSTALAYSRWQHSSASSQLAQVKASIAGLTAKQEQLILAKFAATAGSETIGDSEPLSEPLPDPSFTPAFMAATYGYPHRVGMSQYGAYGRALAGQSYDQILKAYYANVSVGPYSVPSTINVQGYGEISFEDNYLRGISEMPRRWSMEALKAQAVAARSYALDYILRSGKPICTNQYCQVYRGTSDRINCEGYHNQQWCNAVNATRGVVVTSGGVPVATYYASTAGGYTLNSEEIGWNPRAWLKGVKDYGPKGAYDGPNYGKSPWYHTGWGSRNCNKSEYNPWLTKEELADIFNAALLYQKSSNYTRYLSPTDGCLGPPGWSVDQVKAKLVELGTQPINSVSAIVAGPNPPEANTVKVYITSDRGPLDFAASTFRAVFNLRARGYLVIKTGRFDFEAR